MPEQRMTASRATIIAAIFTLVGGVGGAVVTGWFSNRTEALRAQSSIELERRKFQAELILKAIDTEEQQTAIETLTFFAKAGLIPDYQENVLELATADEGAAIPTLRTAPDSQPIDELGLESGLDLVLVREVSRSVAAFMEDGKVSCTAVLIEPLLALVPSYCVRAELERLSLRLDYDNSESVGEPVSIASSRPIGQGLTLLQLDEDDRLEGRRVALATRAPEPGEKLFLIHHPEGEPKEVSECSPDGEAPLVTVPANAEPADMVADMVGNEVLNLVCDTRGGSAGAPVFAPGDGTLLGVYVLGSRIDDGGLAIPVSFIQHILFESYLGGTVVLYRKRGASILFSEVILSDLSDVRVRREYENIDLVLTSAVHRRQQSGAAPSLRGEGGGHSGAPLRARGEQ